MTIRTRLLGGLTGTLLAASLSATPAVAGPVPGVVLPAADTTTARVTKIVDGDTIRTTKGTIRLVGIDTPENGADVMPRRPPPGPARWSRSGPG